jgi:hypothetical protein
LREIAAASDFDFVASEPAPAARKTRARAAKPRGKALRAPLWLSRLWTWRTPLFGGFSFVVLLAAIGVNAMFLQRGRHPAPLMGSVLRIEPPRAEPSAAQASRSDAIRSDALAPEAAKAAASTFEPIPLAMPAPAKAPAAKLLASPAAAPASRSGDAIGALIDKSAPPVPAKKVAAAQKALNKLGAHVPANGQYNDATRKAVEKFQRDNGLPVTGELTPKLRHYLALQAGTTEE